MQVSPSGDTKTLFIEDNKEWLNLHNMLIPLKDEPRFLWASERSVLRYAKSHSWHEVRARVDPKLLQRGAELLAAREQRPLVAPE